MSQYFLKPYEPFGGDINVKVDLSNYATKTDIKNISRVDTSSFALKSNLAGLKIEVVSGNVATKTILNTEINEIKNEIASISSLATTSALIAVENNKSNVSNLIKKTDYDTKVDKIEKKITDHKHDEYITTPEFNKSTAESFAARLAQTDSVTMTDFENKLSDLNRKIVSNKIIHLVIENELKNLKAFDSNYFQGKSNADEDGTDDGAQNWPVFQPTHRYFRTASDKLIMEI